MVARFLSRNLETDERVLAMAMRAPVRARKTAVLDGSDETGTVRAIVIRIPSCPALPGIPPVGSWGGARNSACRTSASLTEKQVELLAGAAAFAHRIGLPLNRHVTLHWQHAGIADDVAALATTAFLKLLLDSIRKSGGDGAALWARENGDGKGSHAHIIAHVPAAQLGMVKRLQRRWVRKATGQPYRAGTLHGRPVAGGSPGDARYHANLEAVVRYVVKGADTDAARLHGLTRLEPGGAVIGKRCGTTQNIGRAAWAAVRFP